MKRVFYRWLLLGGSLLIPAALAAVSANESPSLPDTSNAEAEVIDQTPTDGEVELGLLVYLFNRKRTADDEQMASDGQAPSGVDVKEAYDGPLEELGLLDILLGKEPQPLVIAASLHEADEAVAEPLKDPIPEMGLISYFFNRGNKLIRPVSDPTPAVNQSQPTLATVRSSRSMTPARSATLVESAAMSADLLRIKVVLGLLPRSALASLGQSNYVTARPKLDNDAPLVANTEPQIEVAEKEDSPDSTTPAEVEEKGLLELLLKRRPKATETPSGDNNGNKTSVTPGAEKGELGILDLLLHHRPDAAGVEATKTPTADEHLQNNRE